MSLTSPLSSFLRPALYHRVVLSTVTTTHLSTRHNSTQPEKPSSNPAKKPTPADPSSITLKEPTRDPLEPANSKLAKDHILQPLARPIGLATVPSAGQNTGIDDRTFRQRRDDFFDHDKHAARRKDLTKKMARPYFRDWSRMQFNQGKIFLAPTRLIRADKALYFPNLRGLTLAQPKYESDTTPLAKGCITIVRVFTGRWAEQQVDSWMKDEKLSRMMEEGEGLLRRLDLNVEQNNLKSAVVRLSMPWIRRTVPAKQHDKYFLVRRGFETEYKHALGMFNNQVGHVYLLDDECRVRWGGSGDAQEDEQASLRKGIVKLVQELKERQDRGDVSTSESTRSIIAKLITRIPSILA